MMVNVVVNKLKSLQKVKRTWQNNIYDLARMITQQQRLADIVNIKEVRVVGLKRTGNHAIINWIRKQHQGEVWHLNNIRPQCNPYQTLYQYYPKERLQKEASGNFVKKDCLLYSYEDWPLEQIADVWFEKKHDLYLGKSEIRYDLIILRDPFNLLASRLKNDYMKVKVPSQTVINLWIDYAKEYLGETQYLKNNKICINYNQWFLEIDYRKQIAEQLNFKFSDAGIEEIKNQGGGSSFNKREFDGKASQMDVLARWKFFESDPVYRQLLNNDELLEYSERIFGYLPGTELLKM